MNTKRKKSGRKLLSFLLTLAMVVGLMPGMGMTAFAENEVNYLPTSPGEYKLSSDITVNRNGPVELGSGTISIDLAGHTIRIVADGGYNNRTLFHITSGGVLTIKDSSSGGTGKVTREGTSSNDSVIWIQGGTLNWEGGIVSDVYTTCGIIDVSNGQFNMTGGSFTGNHLSNGGQGAVRLLSGNSFLRISGTPVITGNDGGNVYVSNGSKIEIIGMLNTGANISVNMQTPGVFTTGYGSHYNTESSVSDPWNFFQSDDSENKWVLWNDTFSEAILGSKNDYPERKSITYIINYKDETATPKSGYEISTDGTSTEESPVSLTTILDGNSPKFYVRKSAGEGTEPGEWMEVTLVSRPSEPTGLTSNNATNANTADGTIAGVDNTMEYSADNGKTWIAVSQNTINGLIPGDYLVRVKATNDTPAGRPAEVTVGSKEIILPDDQKPKVESSLGYTGSEHPLVVKGKAEGGTMMYALGTDATTAPTEGWSEAIPTGVDAKTYYVWYMVKGDENHNDTKPACVEATIAKKGLTVTADAKSKTVGEADPALTYTAEGLVAGDTLTGALSREAGEDPGTYAITQGTLTAGDNYEITFTSAVLTINKAPEPDPEPAPAPDPGPAPAPAPSGGGGGGYYGGGTVQNQRRDAYSDVIGAASASYWGSSAERIHNIELACEKLDGIVLQPGEVFSFNEAVGLRTAEAGFEVAPVDANDEATAEMGGGVSQVSSTLYASALLGLLEPVERTNHSFPVSFIQPGTDALVTNPDDGGNAADLKFRNTRTEPIRISATCRVDEATQLREVLIEIRSALTASDYMPILFDNSWSGEQNAFLTATPYDLTRPGYRILLTHEEQAFTDNRGAGIRTLTHRKILDAAGMLVRDEILNSKLPDGSYAMDTYYQG